MSGLFENVFGYSLNKSGNMYRTAEFIDRWYTVTTDAGMTLTFKYESLHSFGEELDAESNTKKCFIALKKVNEIAVIHLKDSYYKVYNLILGSEEKK